jgi:hypothetical protein
MRASHAWFQSSVAARAHARYFAARKLIARASPTRCQGSKDEALVGCYRNEVRCAEKIIPLKMNPESRKRRTNKVALRRVKAGFFEVFAIQEQ